MSVLLSRGGFAIVGIFVLSATVRAQEAPVFNGAPAAHWIAPPNVPGDSFTVFHARRSFALSDLPRRFVIHVSADNRYKLYVNGALVATQGRRELRYEKE